jgi:hypothetical protein
MARLKPGRRQLVIDASVLRASGGADAVHPTASQCRDFLLAVLTICHHVILGDTASDEWKAHTSAFAQTWWTSMLARRKVARVDDRIDEEVRGPLRRADLTDKQRAAIEKDLHLIEAALRADCIIVALDLRLTEYVRIATAQARKLKAVRFVDPREETADEL